MAIFPTFGSELPWKAAAWNYTCKANVLESGCVRGVTFPTLKSLSLGAVWMRRLVYASLCDHCPLLEELFICNINDEYPSTWEGFVTSESIKRLAISVVSLHLSPSSLEVLHWGCKSMPVFNNLLSLSIQSDKERGWQIVPLLLKSSPNLQTLVIKGLVHKVTNECGDACPCIPHMSKKRKMDKEEEMSCLWTCQLKVLEISGYEGACQELKQMKHFLGKKNYLETVKIALQLGNNNYLRVTNALKKLRRVSPRCQMHFF